MNIPTIKQLLFKVNAFYIYKMYFKLVIVVRLTKSDFLFSDFLQINSTRKINRIRIQTFLILIETTLVKPR